MIINNNARTMFSSKCCSIEQTEKSKSDTCIDINKIQKADILHIYDSCSSIYTYRYIKIYTSSAHAMLISYIHSIHLWKWRHRNLEDNNEQAEKKSNCAHWHLSISIRIISNNFFLFFASNRMNKMSKNMTKNISWWSFINICLCIYIL